MKSDTLLKVVCSTDPAIDIAASSLRDYIRTRDLQHIKFLPGEEPTYYYLRRIPHGLFLRYVEKGDTELDRHDRAFMAGVDHVDNLRTYDGAVHSTWSPGGIMSSGRDRVLVMTDDELSLFPFEDIHDVGAAAYGYAFLRPGCVGSYPVPPSWAYALEMATVRSQYAAATRDSAGPNS